MVKVARKRLEALSMYDPNGTYLLPKVVDILKKTCKSKFDASVDVNVNLSIDVQKNDQVVRGNVILPHGTGKVVKVLVLCDESRVGEVRAVGADYVGLEDFCQKIESGWLQVDVVITSPNYMGMVAKRLGKILGPRGLMPNPKNNTVTEDLVGAVKDVKAGKVSFRADKYGIVSLGIGRISFSDDQLCNNFNEFYRTLLKLRPSSTKGIYIKKIVISTTMGLGIRLSGFSS